MLDCFKEGTQKGLLSIREIAAGENHTLALIDVDVGQIDDLNDGELQEESKTEETSKVTRLFVWGCNEKKQLGLNSDNLFDDVGTDEANSNNDRSNQASSNNGS